jgi:Coenzyme PQQ synthesis protein D (PqqD)
MKITLDTKIHRNPEMVSGNMDGEIVMLSVQRGEYFGLDIVGSRIWELIENSITVGKIKQTLLDEYEVDESTCEDDLIEFLEDLQKKGLLITDISG